MYDIFSGDVTVIEIGLGWGGCSGVQDPAENVNIAVIIMTAAKSNVNFFIVFSPFLKSFL